MSSPSIVFVPGSFAQPEFYDNYLEPLISQGYDVHALNLRSALPKDATPPGRPLPTMYDDAAVIAEKLEELSEAGKDIIIVAHSYGGTPASESVKGYSKAAREEKGKRGGVVRLAYMTCLIGDVGQSAGELLQSKTENRIPAELNVSSKQATTIASQMSALSQKLTNCRSTAGCTIQTLSRLLALPSLTCHTKRPWSGLRDSVGIPPRVSVTRLDMLATRTFPFRGFSVRTTCLSRRSIRRRRLNL